MGSFRILSNQDILQNNVPISLDELLRKLYNRDEDISSWFFDEQCKIEREKIAYALYILNYCDRHENHWLRFVNVVCTDDSINKIQIKNSKDFETYLLKEEVFPYISLQITSAGIAYLGYIVQSFEQLSSVSCKKPPLLTTIPTETELLYKRVTDLQCISIIQAVGRKSYELQRRLNKEESAKNEIDYLKNADAAYISYSMRLKNAHSGFVSNFRDIVNEIYSSSSKDVREKAATLSNTLKMLAKYYF